MDCGNKILTKIDKNSIKKIGLPTPNDLSIYTDWRIRESRDTLGNLSYSGLSKRLEIIKDLPLVDVKSGGKIYVKNLLHD